MRRLRYMFPALLAVLLLAAAPASAQKKFVDSDDAKESDEPQKFLPDYDKLIKGKEADWAYYPEGGGFKARFRTVEVKDFGTTNKRKEAEYAAQEGKAYFEEWLKKGGWEIAEKDASLVAEGNICNAWEPSGAARFWGGWYANPGACVEVILKDPTGKIAAEMRHKCRGSTVPDAVENCLEEIVEDMQKTK
ncbi:MAG TPA: hypothetical protein VIE39_07320 [Thermoanaerobaculia bacterium]